MGSFIHSTIIPGDITIIKIKSKPLRSQHSREGTKTKSQQYIVWEMAIKGDIQQWGGEREWLFYVVRSGKALSDGFGAEIWRKWAIAYLKEDDSRRRERVPWCAGRACLTGSGNPREARVLELSKPERVAEWLGKAHCTEPCTSVSGLGSSFG